MVGVGSSNMGRGMRGRRIVPIVIFVSINIHAAKKKMTQRSGSSDFFSRGGVKAKINITGLIPHFYSNVFCNGHRPRFFA